MDSLTSLRLHNHRSEFEEEPMVKCDSCEVQVSEYDEPFQNGWHRCQENLIFCPDCPLPSIQPIQGSTLVSLAEDLPVVGVIIRLVQPVLYKFPSPSIDGDCISCGQPTLARELLIYRGKCEDCFTKNPWPSGAKSIREQKVILDV